MLESLACHCVEKLVIDGGAQALFIRKAIRFHL